MIAAPPETPSSSSHSGTSAPLGPKKPAHQSIPGYFAELQTDVEGVIGAGRAIAVRTRRLWATKLLRKRVSLQRLAMVAAASAIAGLVALIVLLMAAALVLYGVSHACASVLDVPFWAGAILTGSSVLLLGAVAGTFTWKRYARGRRRSVGESVSRESVGKAPTARGVAA